MAEIWTRVTRQRQPRGGASVFGAVNWASPLSPGLVRLVCFDGLQARDLVTSYPLAAFGSSFGSTTTSLGRGSTTSDLNSYWEIPFNGETQASCSIGWVGQFLPGGGAQILIRDNSVSAGNFFFRNSAGNWQHRVGGITATSSATVANGVPYAGVFTGDATIGTTYINGVSVAQSSNGGGGFGLKWFYHQNGNNPGQGFIGTSVLLCIWKRPLSTVEVFEWSRNPWQLFAPERRVSYFFPSTIPTLSAATAVSITSTTATPRVTVTF